MTKEWLKSWNWSMRGKICLKWEACRCPLSSNAVTLGSWYSYFKWSKQFSFIKKGCSPWIRIEKEKVRLSTKKMFRDLNGDSSHYCISDFTFIRFIIISLEQSHSTVHKIFTHYLSISELTYLLISEILTSLRFIYLMLCKCHYQLFIHTHE